MLPSDSLEKIEAEAEMSSFEQNTKVSSKEFRRFFVGYVGEESKKGNSDLESMYRGALESWLVATGYAYTRNLRIRKRDIGSDAYVLAADGYKMRGFYRGVCRAFNKANGSVKEYSDIGKAVADRFSKKIMEEPSILDEMDELRSYRDMESVPKWIESIDVLKKKIFEF